jgi:hypothetical protein
MALSAISSGTQAAQTAQTSKVSNEAAATKKATAQEVATQLAKTDKVTVSKQAAQLANKTYSPQEELKESSTQKAKEAAQGKK